MNDSNFWPRVRIQYFGDDWLFINSYSFKVDEWVFDYKPVKTIERDNRSGYVWEILDESPNEEVQLNTIWEFLTDCKTAKVRFKGDKYSEDIKINRSQLNSLKKLRELYKEARTVYGITPK